MDSPWSDGCSQQWAALMPHLHPPRDCMSVTGAELWGAGAAKRRRAEQARMHNLVRSEAACCPPFCPCSILPTAAAASAITRATGPAASLCLLLLLLPQPLSAAAWWAADVLQQCLHVSHHIDGLHRSRYIGSPRTAAVSVDLAPGVGSYYVDAEEHADEERAQFAASPSR